MKRLPAPTSPQLRGVAAKGRARVTRGLVVLLLVLAGVLWSGPLVAHARAVLLISQVLPQVPVKPRMDRPVYCSDCFRMVKPG